MTGTEDGFWRRMNVIPFVEKIGENEKDRELPEKLIAEADGILRWLVDGYAAWLKNGLQVPDIVRDTTASYRREMDPLQQFFEEWCRDNADVMSEEPELYGTYCTMLRGERQTTQATAGVSEGA